jgi:hypothetical protein
MRCECGHSDMFHEPKGIVLVCEECDECSGFKLDPNWEPPSPPGWEGGFADNH